MSGLHELDFSYPKIFVTGIYGSGKTAIARQIAARNGSQYVSFDNGWNYGRSIRPGVGTGYAGGYFAKLGERFTLDAIPFNPLPDLYISFSEYYGQNEDDILIVCTLCLSMEEWLARLKRKTIKHGSAKTFSDYVEFHTKYLRMHKSRMIVYYDTVSDRYVSADDVHVHAESVIREREKANRDAQ